MKRRYYDLTRDWIKIKLWEWAQIILMLFCATFFSMLAMEVLGLLADG